ncbi:MAG TPA: peptidoglycan bridge formation glycyltransferase FemA/FemB family protein [Candidatus Sulfotelmatobacter sp.]|nr:peptidoglycan bridge formation glycyltransferase FemA/FemB family protein [Candidatus Sulfotelmatobacter sp.]
MNSDVWSQLLGLFDDGNIYQTWSYGAVRWGRKNLSHLVLKRKDEVVAIAQLRIVRPANLNFGMAYLRWGPLCRRHGMSGDLEVAEHLMRALQEEYVSKRKLLLKILPNAFEGSDRAEFFQRAFSKFMQEPFTPENTYRTFVLDLEPSIEQLRRKLDKKWRNQLARAEKNGLKIVMGTGTDEYRTFCEMYRQMRDRKPFETSVNIEEFAEIQANLPEAQRMQVLICRQNDVPVAGIVASPMGDSAIYLLGATSDDGLTAKGSYLLQWTLIQWLKEKGVRWYDLGGIDPDKNPGVYHFKRGLSGTDIRQLTPFTSCTNTLSSAVVKAGLALDRTIRDFRLKTAFR